MVPGYEEASAIDQHPSETQGKHQEEGQSNSKENGPNKREFFVSGRRPTGGVFSTENGRAKLFPITLNRRPHGLRLMTIRSEGQFNTVVYEEEDRYRGQERRDIILLAANDIAQLGLKENQFVRVESSSGEMNVLVRTGNIKTGNAAMYYPEANILVPREVDQHSRTPSFKDIAIHITPAEA